MATITYAPPTTTEKLQKLPWGILILFGGGLALASGLSKVGIIQMIGEAISQNSTWTMLMVASILIVVMLFMTELMSNVALVAIFCPVVAGIAIGLDSEILHMRPLGITQKMLNN